MTDLDSFLDVAGTEAAVVLAGASDELGIDIEDLRHDFLEGQSASLGQTYGCDAT